MGLDDLYQEIILDHYKKPRHPGRLEAPVVEVRHYNPVCGDELTLGLAVEAGRVADIAVDAIGCAISQASASVMTEVVNGHTLEEGLDAVEAFRSLLHGDTPPDADDRLGDGIAFEGVARYPVRVKCALLGWMAFMDAATRVEAGEARGETRHDTDPGDRAVQAAKAAQTSLVTGTRGAES